ncbi:Glyceraldehyde-3-phosphate dehydrogenase (NADP(+)) [[Mycoplasma] cavipharyngis]|uniref:aldehyde dehydrogenase family protein n=1 Tax=[Mycoplasma] cavipharyngis TaxID=92757 RepID=UPI0037039C88
MKDFSAYINGQFVNSEQKVKVYNPENQALIGTFPALSKTQIDQAYKAASDAFLVWSQFDHQKRAQFLLNFAASLKEHAKVIADLMVQEIAKSFKEAETEVLRTVDYITETVHAYLELVETPEVFSHATEVSMPKEKVATYFRKPYGVALTISPFNYPVNLMMAKIAPALIVGNTIVHKSASQGSLVGAYVAQLFADLVVDGKKLPPGVFNYVTGKGSEIGDYLVEHPAVQIVSFTGGTETGKKIAAKMMMKPYVLELGGKDAALVLDDADDLATAKEIVKGAYNFSGQRCTAIKRVFVSDQKAKTLVPELVKEVAKLVVGSAKDNSNITPLVEASSVQLIKQLYDDAISKGAKNLSAPLTIKNHLVSPVLLDYVTQEMDLAWTEPFAPILPIIRYHNIDQAISLINQSEYGLQGSIFTQDYHQAVALAHKFDTGTVNVNRASSRGPDILPFLGIKSSGYGVQGIREALKFFTRIQGLVLNDKTLVEQFNHETNE